MSFNACLNLSLSTQRSQPREPSCFDPRMAIGLQLMTLGVFSFCVEDIVLRYSPNWIPTSGFFSQFFDSIDGKQHLIVKQWLSIMLGAIGASLFIFSLGGSSQPVDGKSDQKKKS
ncbi:MAG: hypothetical protein R3C11_05385 [Planctomycetaceae bacterium]